MNMIELIVALAFGIPTGLGIALFLLSGILSRNVLGKNENTFESYSKFPIKILDEQECSTFLGMDSGIRWRKIKKNSGGMSEEERKKMMTNALANMKYRP